MRIYKPINLAKRLKCVAQLQCCLFVDFFVCSFYFSRCTYECVCVQSSVPKCIYDVPAVSMITSIFSFECEVSSVETNLTLFLYFNSTLSLFFSSSSMKFWQYEHIERSILSAFDSDQFFQIPAFHCLPFLFV